MKSNYITIILGVLCVIILTFVFTFTSEAVFNFHKSSMLEWIPLLICAFGFYLAGRINKNVELRLLPILYISLLIFVPLRFFYFPFIFLLIIFSSFGLLVTRNEIKGIYKKMSFVIIALLFTYKLISQPLIIEKKGFKISEDGNFVNALVIWDLEKKKKNQVLENLALLNFNKEKISLKSLENQNLYITFWATWCPNCLAEKPNLDKLKKEFEGNKEITFVDISLDKDKDRWLKYLKKNDPMGMQLIAVNEGETRRLLGIESTPQHVIVNGVNGNFKNIRSIAGAKKILQDQVLIDKYVK